MARSHRNAMNRGQSWLPMVAAIFLIPVAVLVFAVGFFPYKPFLPGRAAYAADDVVQSAPFDKIIFMVVDALRRSAYPSVCCKKMT